MTEHKQNRKLWQQQMAENTTKPKVWATANDRQQKTNALAAPTNRQQTKT